MSKQDDNTLGMLIDVVRRAWWHRPGYEPIGQVLDTFDALGYVTRTGQKPVLAHKHRIPGGWHLVLNLPPGISSKDVEAKLYHFEEQAGGRITLKTNGPKLHMDIVTTTLPRKVAYEWEPGDYPEMALPVPIGHTGAELLTVDLARVPHVMVAGNVGGGKTTALNTAAVSLIRQGAIVAVIDLKGLDFAHLQESNHALVVDDEDEALKVLQALNREHDRRVRKLRAARVVKLQDYPGDDLPWIVAMIDELAELQEKESQEALNRLARLSRATGICLMVATQRPSHTLFNKFTDTRMLFAGRLCFHMPKEEDSRLILGSDAASRLNPDIPGRGIWQWDKQVEVQGMYLSIKESYRILADVQPRGEVRFERSTERLLPR